MHERLALLATVDEGVTESEVFRLALQHSVSELGCLGGTVHLCGPMSELRLVSATGLPPALTRSWEILDQEGPTAPALAIRRGESVWVPAGTCGELPAEPATGSAAEADASYEPPADPPAAVVWPGTGLASVPATGGQRALGAVTLVMGAGGEPTAEQWDFLRAVVAWAEERTEQAPPPSGPPQEELSTRQLRQALKAIQIGTWDWNLRTGEVHCDDAALVVYGADPADFAPRIENWMKVVHPDDLGWTLAEAEKAIRNRTVFEAEYRVRRPDGGYSWAQARGQAVLDNKGEPVRLVGRVWDSNESRAGREALSRALRHMSDGFLSVDEDWRITFVNLVAERTLGLSEEELFGKNLWELPTARDLPDLEAQSRAAAAAGKSATFDMRTPEGISYHLRLVPVPGGLTLYFTDVTEQQRVLDELASTERAAADRAARIAELTTTLARATTSRDVVDAVAQRVLPPFGASALMVLAVEGDRLSYIGSVGYPRSFVDQIIETPAPRDGPIWQTIRTGSPLFISSEEELKARYPGLRRRPSGGDQQSWAFLSLAASGHTFGVCVIAFERPRRLTDEARTLLTAISALVAHALERARLFDAEHIRSQQLQRGLLPRTLPDLPECTAAARYLPAGQGMDVGGDWYDIIPLSAGQVALVIGDVMGHGLPEAVTMGRVRTAVHTLAALGLPPDEIMSHLNEIVGALGEDSFVTCLYALYDSTTGICSIARAGHPPPAVVHPDGTVHFPELAPNPPLGAAEPPFETVELVLPPESLLVLYTDGLVESPLRDIDDGMADLGRLLRTAVTAVAGDSENSSGSSGSSGSENSSDGGDGEGTGGSRDSEGSGGTVDLNLLCDTLTAGLLPADQPSPDDAALLVTRVHSLATDRMASWPLPAHPQAAGEARRYVREQLSAWGLDELTMTTELLASELVGNVVRHAKGPVRLRLLRSTGLVCEVGDGSLTMPRIRRSSETDEGGRGLQLITALSQRWGTRYTPTGKCIWTEQALPVPCRPPGSGSGTGSGAAGDVSAP